MSRTSPRSLLLALGLAGCSPGLDPVAGLAGRATDPVPDGPSNELPSDEDGDTAATSEPDSGGDSATPEDTEAPPEASGSPLAGLRLFVDPASRAAQQAQSWADSRPQDAELMRRIAEQPVAMWLGAWSGNVRDAVTTRQAAARAADSVAAFVVYNIPQRDCGGYSSGGTRDPASYRAWVQDIATGLGGWPSIVVLEPDALTLTSCLDEAGLAERQAMLREAGDLLSQAGASVYLDVGHSAWLTPDQAVTALAGVGLDGVAGFAVNVSNFRADDELLLWAGTVASRTGARFILDTSRNGLGPEGNTWCNPSDRALGLPPDTDPPEAGLDARLWVKAPGESDGSCNGGPSAGTWWPEYALGLARRAPWTTAPATALR